MTGTLYILTSFALAFAVQAQANIDSLLNVLNTRTLAPGEQLKLYGRICLFYLDRSPEKAAGYIKKGMELARKAPDMAGKQGTKNLKQSSAGIWAMLTISRESTSPPCDFRPV
jgi:hypothetical protein